MIGTRRSIRAALAAIATVFCVLGPLAVPSAAASGSGTPVSLGTGDDQAAITVHVGDTINVRLRPDGQFHFSAPTSSDEAVLHRQGGGGGRGHGHHHKVTEGRASFNALAAGTATLEAFGTIRCTKSHKICPAERTGADRLIARRWHVDVTVE